MTPPNLKPLLSDASRATASRVLTIFLTGLFAVLPILVTVSLMSWLINAAESVLGGFVSVLLPGDAYRRGMGLIGAIVLIFVVGLAMQGLITRQLLAWLDHYLNRIPLIKTIYGAARDLTDMVSNPGSQKLGRVVMVQWPDQPIRLVGFVTVENLKRFDIADCEDCVAVYLPMSYQIGGYTAMIPRSHLTPLDMSVEDAMRFVVTAGVSRNEKKLRPDVARRAASTPAAPAPGDRGAESP